MTLAQLDELLSAPELKPPAGALLPLRLCQFAQVLRPDPFDSYWEQLAVLGDCVPGASSATFDGMEALREPPAHSVPEGFPGEIVTLVRQARTVASSRSGEAAAFLRECQRRLERRRWPFGKPRLWAQVAGAWADSDRKQHGNGTIGDMGVHMLDSLDAQPGLAEAHFLYRANSDSAEIAGVGGTQKRLAPGFFVGFIQASALEHLMEQD